jgi:hypothetical protein
MKKNQLMMITRTCVAAMTVLSIYLLSGCEAEDPQKEDTPELITRAVLTFTPDTGEAIVVTATDPDAEGLKSITMDKAIALDTGRTYRLSVALINELADATDPEYNITTEVEEQSDEHMFFFEWTGSVFSDPSGNGNIDNRADALNYEDQDANGLPIGLQTSWTAGAPSSGLFRVVLKHQPGLKTVTSDSSLGETDLDVTFDITVQ